MNTIGIDVGGTGVAVGVVTDRGQILAREETPTRGYDQTLGEIVRACRSLSAKHDASGVGICCPGPLNLTTGEILNEFTMNWHGRSITRDLRNALSTEVAMENDADAALLAEMRFGAGTGESAAVMLTFGTGAGGAAFAHGRLLRGSGNEHPEIGHMPVLPDDLECYCGVRGCMEIIASGTALLKEAQSLGLSGPGELFVSEKAARFRDRLNRAMDSAAAVLIRCYAPGVIILGGGVIDHQFEAYAEPMRGAIARQVMMPPGGTRVAQAALGNDAGIVGAATLVMEAPR